VPGVRHRAASPAHRRPRPGVLSPRPRVPAAATAGGRRPTGRRALVHRTCRTATVARYPPRTAAAKDRAIARPTRATASSWVPATAARTAGGVDDALALGVPPHPCGRRLGMELDAERRAHPHRLHRVPGGGG